MDGGLEALHHGHQEIASWVLDEDPQQRPCPGIFCMVLHPQVSTSWGRPIHEIHQWGEAEFWQVKEGDVNEDWCKGQVFKGRWKDLWEHICWMMLHSCAPIFIEHLASMYCQFGDANVLKHKNVIESNKLQSRKNIQHTCFCDEGPVTKLHGIRGPYPHNFASCLHFIIMWWLLSSNACK